METAHLNLIWANKPECSKAVAEVWIGESDLWFTVFIDDRDKALRVEIFRSTTDKTMQIADLTEVERLLEIAKRELLAMADSSMVSV